MLRFIVHVVGHEGGTSLNSGGFDWYFKKSDADLKYVNSLLNKAIGEIIYQGEVEVYLPDELESEPSEDITDFVEAFLTENGWEKSFENKFGEVEK